jgi:hypothetical protein
MTSLGQSTRMSCEDGILSILQKAHLSAVSAVTVVSSDLLLIACPPLRPSARTPTHPPLPGKEKRVRFLAASEVGLRGQYANTSKHKFQIPIWVFGAGAGAEIRP